ncbi:MAG: SMP-30/gluconolactonase/LRE family protein [Dehalococcoidia bacterium]|nr:SMP-30/gluconolactonase/LRE family protein [Dehalococcoidia bacterium]
MLFRSMRTQFHAVLRVCAAIAFAATTLLVLPMHSPAPILADEAPFIFLDKWGEYGTDPGEFFSPSGVAVGVDGKVYVADTSNDRVQVLDDDGTTLATWGTEGSGANQFNDPEGIAVDSAGNIYVADTDNNRVVILNSVGTVIHILDGHDAGADNFQYPHGIDVSPDGNTLYIADTYNHSVHIYTMVEGTYAYSATIGDYEIPGTGDAQFNGPAGVAVGPDGSVYVADTTNRRVQKFDAAGAFVTKWGEYGQSAGQFWDPEGITVDADGDVYVTDTGNGRIQKFTEDGEFLIMFGSMGSGDYRFSYPDDVAVTVDGDIVVADTGNDCLKLYGPAEFYEDPPRFLREWGSEGGGLTSPLSIAIDDDGYVYVGEDAQRVQKFTGTGSLITTWGTPGSGDNQLFGPSGIALDSEDSVYVSDSQNHRVHRLALNGTTGLYESVERWGAPAEDLFYYPNGVAVDADDNVYVVDSGNHCVQMLDADSGEWSVFAGTKGTYGDTTDADLFCNPRGIAVDHESGWIYVVDYQNARIKKFDTSGTLLTMWGSYGQGPDEFNVPCGIALDPVGNVYVIDCGDHCIQKFNSDGGFMSEWGTSGTEDGEFNMPFGVAVHPNGDIYVADYGNNRIQVFTYSELDSVEIALKTGWNTVSVPLELAQGDDTVEAIFGDDIEAIYTWNAMSKSYEAPSTIEPGLGYWVAVSTDTTISIDGTPLATDDWECQAHAGWNMIGSASEAVLVGALTEDVSGDPLQLSAVYWWNPVAKSYEIASSIQPCKGYWLASTADCNVTMTLPE